ncbi:MAG TPA: class I SAM-dependent methyltransferase [Candidatus Limnocylindrales bacterium]|nr:class I SAM-dependent methyltransferase [Candidatus Limnocylindrales bacterium]
MPAEESSDRSSIKDSLAVFQTNQGIELRGNLLRFTRHLVVIEIYTPSVILQTSEVLSEFRIICNDRILYSGRAIVRSLVNAGSIAVCEASLEDAWIDIDFGISASTPEQLGSQFERFLGEWQKLYRVLPEYKVAIADLQTFLSEVRLWLEQVELGIRSSPSADRVKLELEVSRKLGHSVVPAINNLFERFETVAQRLDEESQPAHRAFGKRQLHPLLLCSPFVYRTFQKPLGFAGDYEIVNMMFREPYEGASLFAKVINTYALQLPPIVAHRNRINFLVETLGQEVMRVARQNRVAKIYNMGCGPAQEVQRFLANNLLSGKAHFTLADFNEETLAHTNGVLCELKRRHHRDTPIQLIKRSVQQTVKEGDRNVQRPAAELYDLVYCAGLFDYLSDKVCAKLINIFYEMLAPEGLLVITNVDVHPSRAEMEHFLEWNLVHRNTVQLRALAPTRVSPEQLSILQDPTGVNLFMCIRRNRA